MGISLYKHNLEAYEKVVRMLDDTSMAAVIHPTGTGKSFIGFKLCEDHPESTVCWISPSEYIWKTQLDNLAEAADGWKPDNVTFITYARLSCLTEGEMSALNPDYIILDEFHRCGAQVWGLGVLRLLSMYDDAKILGLSATAVRYLDNQRNMADEIFDGNVASEMTLGEAIVRGILKAPKYVLSLYGYSESLNRYEMRINRLRNKAQQDRAEEYLEALRRTVSQAEGLDEMFEKYMPDRCGKYIIFCADYEAMKEAVANAGKWFGNIDKKPHIYSVYSEIAGSEKEFIGFKNDESKHLRLLYCINALNEGVHIGDISGVILLRPTVSPIIYKQQIGRGLSAADSNSPVIFDVVNNIEGLYSIDAVKGEMMAAINYFRSSGKSSIIVNGDFEITGKLVDCLDLFDKLEDTISSSWEVMYQESKAYYEEHGDLLMNKDYINDTGYPIGRWVSTQRILFNNGELNEDRKTKLDEIGMNWMYSNERSWAKGYSEFEVYVNEHENPQVPAAFITEEGFALGSWYRNVQKKYTEGRLSDGHIEAMEKLGVKWDPVHSERWNANYECAKRYRQEHGDLQVSYDYVTEDGIRLGVWISVQRDQYRKKRLSKEQINLLEMIDMDWNAYKSRWDKAYLTAIRYYMEHGNINSVPADYKESGVKLAMWLRAQRVSYSQGKLSKERIDSLERLKIIWNPQEALWNKGYEEALKYEREYGNINVPKGYITPDGYKLKNWLNNQTTRFKTGRMSEEQRAKLEKIGISFV